MHRNVIDYMNLSKRKTIKKFKVTYLEKIGTFGCFFSAKKQEILMARRKVVKWQDMKT